MRAFLLGCGRGLVVRIDGRRYMATGGVDASHTRD
jgi:hypothetical protein